MKITYKGDYALKVLLDLALHYKVHDVITIHDLAESSDVPTKFLEQVLLDLKKGGFVESKRGKVGGYYLAKHPAQIRLGDVIRFIDGPIEPIGCVENKYSGCGDMHKCIFRKIWQDVSNATSAIVDTITFEDLVNQSKSTQKTLVYSI
jgi:Rrf2 family protein